MSPPPRLLLTCIPSSSSPLDLNLNSVTHLRLGLERDEFELGVECEEELVDGGLAGVPLAHAADHDAAAVLGAVRQDDVQLLLVHPAQRHLTLDAVYLDEESLENHVIERAAALDDSSGESVEAGPSNAENPVSSLLPPTIFLCK